MRQKRCFLSILAFALMALGCKEKALPTYYVSQELLRYCWFPEGSYWIYEEGDSSGIFDSVIASDAVKRINPDEGDGYNFEGYGLTLHVLGKDRRQATVAWAAGSNMESTTSVTTEFFSDSSGQQYDYLHFWDSRGLDTLEPRPSTFVSARFDSVTIHGEVYYDAIEITNDPPSTSDFTYKVIWAKDVGIIRRKIIDGTTWELVRHHIN